MRVDDDRLVARAPGPAAEERALLAEDVSPGTRSVVVVVSHPGHHKRDPLPPLQPREVVDEIVDHLHVLNVVVGRQGLALLVLTGRGWCISQQSFTKALKMSTHYSLNINFSACFHSAAWLNKCHGKAILTVECELWKSSSLCVLILYSVHCVEFPSPSYLLCACLINQYKLRC